MSASTLERILGPNYRLTLAFGNGSLSVSQHTEISIDESPTNKDANVAQSTDDEKVFLKKKCKVSIKGLRGLNNCYSDLPAQQQRITGITFTLVDDDGNEIQDAEDLPNLIYDEDDNPGGYKKWAVVSKKGSQKEDSGDFEMELESGYLNAKA